MSYFYSPKSWRPPCAYNWNICIVFCLLKRLALGRTVAMLALYHRWCVWILVLLFFLSAANSFAISTHVLQVWWNTSSFYTQFFLLPKFSPSLSFELLKLMPPWFFCRFFPRSIVETVMCFVSFMCASQFPSDYFYVLSTLWASLYFTHKRSLPQSFLTCIVPVFKV
jgi:hypothetical protein